MDVETHRQCTTCLRTKPIDEFSFKVLALKRRHAKCRACVAVYNAAYYAQNAPKLVDDAHARKSAQKEFLRAVRSRFLTDRACQRCGDRPAARIIAPRELTAGKPVSDAIRNGWGTARFIGLLTAAEENTGLLCAPCCGRRDITAPG